MTSGAIGCEEMLSTVLLYLTLAVCAGVIGQAVRRYDLHTREPMWTLVLATAVGAGFMELAGQTQLGVLTSLHAAGGLVSDTTLAVLAGVTEELGKLAAVAVVMLSASRHFNEVCDGVIYGAFAGLGAALAESVAILSGEGAEFLPPQEPVRLAGHLIMGGIAAAGLGALAVGERRAWLWLPLGVLVAVSLHTAWDVLAFDAVRQFRGGARRDPLHTIGPIVIMLVGMILFRWLVARGAHHDARRIAARASAHSVFRG